MMTQRTIALVALTLTATGISFAAGQGMQQRGCQCRDTHRNSVITRQEFSRRADVLFGKADVNHDGKIKRTEARQGFAALRAKRAQYQGQFFTRLDKNRDGVITRGECPRGGRFLERMDLNRDGKVTRNEAATARARFEKGAPARHEKMFGRLDTNRNGVITKDEMTARTAKAFDRLDANRDGQITRDELHKVRGGFRHRK